jgi:hypothetical protein
MHTLCVYVSPLNQLLSIVKAPCHGLRRFLAGQSTRRTRFVSRPSVVGICGEKLAPAQFLRPQIQFSMSFPMSGDGKTYSKKWPICDFGSFLVDVFCSNCSDIKFLYLDLIASSIACQEIRRINNFFFLLVSGLIYLYQEYLRFRQVSRSVHFGLNFKEGCVLLKRSNV